MSYASRYGEDWWLNIGRGMTEANYTSAWAECAQGRGQLGSLAPMAADALYDMVDRQRELGLRALDTAVSVPAYAKPFQCSLL